MPPVLTHSLPPEFSANSGSHPILSSPESIELEGRLLATNEEVWQAMRSVGKKLARLALAEFEFGFRAGNDLNIFALVGKGHNGGDALLAVKELVEEGRVTSVVLGIASPMCDLKEHTSRALLALREGCGECRLEVLEFSQEEQWLSLLDATLSSRTFDLSFDGLLGMQFRPPLRPLARRAIEIVNGFGTLGLRVAVDMPSGLGGDQVFKADVSVATGIVKDVLAESLGSEQVGHIRYLDIGFFRENSMSANRVLISDILAPLRRRRPSISEKRQHGHLLILAGSRSMPGALLMSVQAAVSSAVGLVTVFAPESICPQLAVAVPEAMWVPWPETPEGDLALEGEYLLRRYESRATALLIGPGMGQGDETMTLISSVVSYFRSALILDADALQPSVLQSLKKRSDSNVLLTPHLGEFRRIADCGSSEVPSNAFLLAFAKEYGVVLALKGSNMRVLNESVVYLNTTGNSVLSRGGSGDVLAGICGSLLAQFPKSVTEVGCMGAYWHGQAADLLAYEAGQVAIRTTQLIEYLTPALAEELPWD